MSGALSTLSKYLSRAMSLKNTNNNKSNRAELPSVTTDIVILAFGSSHSGKSDVLERIRLGGQPINQDICKSNTDPTGVKEIRILHNGVSYQILDTGDAGSMQDFALCQVTEVTAIMFIANLAGYDQLIPSNPSRTLLQADVELFSTVVDRTRFKNTPIVLCFNGAEELKRKLDSVPLWKVFPDYMEPGFESDAICYLGAKFWELGVGREIDTYVSSRSCRADFFFLEASVRDILKKRSEKVLEE